MSDPDRPAEHPGGTEPEPRSRRLKAHHVQTVVDKAIEQAQREGAFDDLPGAGKPLHLSSSDDPEWWVKGFIEREGLDFSEALPGPLQLRRERAGFPESLLHLADESAVRERLEDFNARVLADRARPVVGDASPPVVGRVDVEDMVGRWREAVAAREQGGRSDHDVAPATTTDHADEDASPEGGNRTHEKSTRRWWAPWRR